MANQKLEEEIQQEMLLEEQLGLQRDSDRTNMEGNILADLDFCPAESNGKFLEEDFVQSHLANGENNKSSVTNGSFAVSHPKTGSQMTPSPSSSTDWPLECTDVPSSMNWDEIESPQNTKSLTSMLKEKMEMAEAALTEAREAMNNPELRESFKKSKFGFGQVSDDQKGAYFDEIIDFLNPFLTNLIGEKMESKKGIHTVIMKLKEHFRKHTEEKKKTNGRNESTKAHCSIYQSQFIIQYHSHLQSNG